MRIFDRPATSQSQQTKQAQQAQPAKPANAANESSQVSENPAPAKESSLLTRLRTGFESVADRASQTFDQAKKALHTESPLQGDRSLASEVRNLISTSHLSMPRPTRGSPDAAEGGNASADRPGGSDAPANSVKGRFYGGTVDATAARSDAKMNETINLNGSKADRLRAANDITQMDNKYNAGANGNGCGAACIVNGAMIQGGQKGLQDLVRVIESRGNKTVLEQDPLDRSKGRMRTGSIPEYEQLGAIKERIASGTVSKGDIAALQSIVHQQMRHMEYQKFGVSEQAKSDSIAAGVMKDYIKTDLKDGYWGLEPGVDQPIKGMFDQMNIKHVSIYGDQNPDHYVLFLNDGNGSAENTLYDPWPRKDGNQIVQDPDQLQTYHHGVLNAMR